MVTYAFVIMLLGCGQDILGVVRNHLLGLPVHGLFRLLNYQI